MTSDEQKLIDSLLATISTLSDLLAQQRPCLLNHYPYVPYRYPSSPNWSYPYTGGVVSNTISPATSIITSITG